MKRFLLFIIIFFASIALLSCDHNNNVDDKDYKNKTVNIFQINDTHGASLSDQFFTGMDKVQSVLDGIETIGNEYIKIVNGDAFQGGYVSNETKGEVFVDIFNQMEFDCFVIGNHEFDWGIEVVAKYKDGDPSNGEANFPFLGANIIDKRTNERPSWIDEYVVVENNGYKVGIIGLIGENLETSVEAEMITNYEFVPSVPIVERLAKKLRNDEKCDCVIVSIHDYSSNTNASIGKLSGDSKIDAIVCGHTHQSIEEYQKRSDGYQIPIVQSYTKNGNVGTIKIRMNKDGAQSGLIKHYEPNNYPASNEFEDIIDKYYDYMFSANIIVCEAKHFLSRDELGSIATNSMVSYFNCDFGIMNTGGVRTTIPKGKIYKSDITEVFPFDNYLYLCELSGSALKSLYNKSKDFLYFNTEFDVSKLVNSKTYKVCVIDYVFGGSYYGTIFSSSKHEKTSVGIKDVVYEYFYKLGKEQNK